MREICLSCFLLAVGVTWGAGARGFPDAPKSLIGTFPLQAPYTGHLVLKNSTRHMCYGTFVSPSGYVLTAAHCVHANLTDAESPLLSDLQLLMGDSAQTRFNLRFVFDDPIYDWAILQVDSPTPNMDPYGWLVFEPGRPQEGERLIRADHGSACSSDDRTDLLHMELTCDTPVIPGDSGEVLLFRGRIAGMLQSTRGNNSKAVTGYAAYFWLNFELGAPSPMVVATSLPDFVPIDTAFEFTVTIANQSAFNAQGGGIVVTSDGGSVNCTMPSSAVWGPREQRTVTCSAQSSAPGTLQFRYRAFLNWGDSNHQINDPWYTNDLDGEGWPSGVLAGEAENVGVYDPRTGAVTFGAFAADQNSAYLRGGITLGYSVQFTGFFNYGLTSAYGSSTPPVEESLNAEISGLQCGTEYHYQAVALATPIFIPGAPPQLVTGEDRFFTTPECSFKGITDLMGYQQGISCRHYVNLWASVTPNATPQILYYSYWPCASKGCDSSALSIDFGFMGRSDGSTIKLQGLSCGTTYHARLNALTFGVVPPVDFDFTTLDCRLVDIGNCLDDPFP